MYKSKGVINMENINLRQIPETLKDIDNFLLWKAVEKNGRISKVPRSYLNAPINIKQQENTTDYETVLQALENAPHKFSGIGFSLLDSGVTNDNGERLTFLDIDDKLSDPFIELLKNKTYIEYSPSGNGLHALFYVDYNERLHENLANSNYEIYNEDRYMTLTGNLHEYSTQDIKSVDMDTFNIILKPFLQAKKDKKERATINENDTTSGTCSLSVDEIITKLRNDKARGKDYAAIIDGRFNEVKNSNGLPFVDENGEIDLSRIDMCLMNALARVTNADKSKMFEVYRSCPEWYRQEKDHATGRIGNTINRAIADYQAFKRNNVKAFNVEVRAYRDIEHIRKDDNALNGIKYGSWWVTSEDANGKEVQKFIPLYMGEYIIQNLNVVRYKESIYLYDEKQGYYLQDESKNILLSRMVRSLSPNLKNSQVSEVISYVISMCDTVEEEESDLIPVKNGLLDPYTKELKEFSPKYFITGKIPTEYKPNAFNQFVEDTLNKVSNNYEPTYKNITEMFATVLYPKFLVAKMFYLYGLTASNGKSTVLNMIHSTFNNGNNISSVSLQTLADSEFATGDMVGKLANIVDDLPSNEINDVGNLKTMITGGLITVNNKYKDGYTVRWQSPLITASNHYPRFKEAGKQINKRLYMIPFEYDFTKDPQEISEFQSMNILNDEQAKEYVLKLSVDALSDMLKRSNTTRDVMTDNERVNELMDNFSNNENPLLEYVDETQRDKEYFLSKPFEDIYKEYKHYCKSSSVKEYSKENFKKFVMEMYKLNYGKPYFLIGRKKVQRAGFIK